MEPTLTVVNVKIENLLTTSPNGDVTYDTSETPIDAGDVGAREHHSIWDEEE